MLRLGPAFRSLIFTALVPVVIAYFLPRWVGYHPTIWLAEWLMIIPGVVIYTLCLIRFLAAGGTPAIFFTRPLRFVIGETPTVFGQGLIAYGLIVWICFHVVGILLEEPQLGKQNGEPYDEYRRKVPRWFLRFPTSKPNPQ